MAEIRSKRGLSISRLSAAFSEPRSSVGRWVKERSESPRAAQQRFCPVSGAPDLRQKIRALCEEDRYKTYGYRRIHAQLKKDHGLTVNRKTVIRIMREQGLTRPKVWRRPQRPKRVEKMKPSSLNQCWQIDMTSFQLSSLATMFLIVVIDCHSRKIVGWNLSRRCRASEWIAALRMALEGEGLDSKEKCRGLTLRSDNGSQPCSKKFIEFLGSRGVKGQYTGYDAPDDNAFVERVIRTVKEEEVWPNCYDTFQEAHQAIENYANFYNKDRIHSALGYLTPEEFAEKCITLKAA